MAASKPSRSRSRSREPSRSRSRSREFRAQPSSSVKWTYTSCTRPFQCTNCRHSDEVIASEDFDTEEEARSYACRAAFAQLHRLHSDKLKKVEHEILEAGPEKLMDYGWICDKAKNKKEGWFVRPDNFEGFTWSIKKKRLTKIDVNDGWNLDVRKKLEERRTEIERSESLEKECSQSYRRWKALWPKITDAKPEMAEPAPVVDVVESEFEES